MATYKVLQDIEAEDKLVGPLTLRQFIYGAVTVVCLYICFILVTKHAGYFVVLFLPPAIVSGFFAFPWGREQPTEIWALAKIRFMILPRRRVWNQSGVKEFVTVTAPKRVEVDYTNGLTETEVSSRLKALADTIDSRGWAIKNMAALPAQPALIGANPADSDRLVGVNTLPEVQPIADVQPADDMLDEQYSPVARQFDQMLERSNTEHRERIKLEMSQAQTPVQPPPVQASQPAAPPNDYWFLSQAPTTGPAQVITPGTPAVAAPAVVKTATPTADEEALVHRFREHNQKSKDAMEISYGHLRTIQPLSVQQQQAAQAAAQTAKDDKTNVQTAATAAKLPSPPVTQPPNPATLKYVNNDDLTVATIARQVNENPPDEIVISLH